jgi:hypothetical protein
MTDQGENIVFLAREILNAGQAEPTAPAKKLHITMTFKTLCLTTMLAATGGGVITTWTQANERRLTRYEQTEIDALIFYATKVKGLDEATLRRDMAQKVGITGLDDLTSGEFPAARQFLQEQAQ